MFLAAVLSTAASVPLARAASPETLTYVPHSLAESAIALGPWTLHESDGYAQHDASGIVPGASQTAPPYKGTGTPYAGLCNGTTKAANNGRSVMQPFYFPFVRRHGSYLQGFFDYRPRNEDEAVVTAISSDEGASWTFEGQALALNPFCPWDPTDPDNQSVNVNGVKTPYGSNNQNGSDNGQGHPTVFAVGGVDRLYTLNRATNHIDADGLVVHNLGGRFPNQLSFLPQYGYVSPLASAGYPKLDARAQSTTGLMNPDAIIGAVTTGAVTTVVYVQKQLGADTKLGYPVCPATPGFALTTIANGKPRKPNDDVTTVRVATTTDGVNFKDVGPAAGLNDPTTTALNGIRYLGSGSLLQMPNGHYGMFFGAGSCLDNDSDGFHFIGYAETVRPVTKASDLLQWQVVNGLDNPIVSTDRVVDPSTGRAYPLNAPLVDVQGVDRLSPSQVAPFAPPNGPNPPAGGYASNFFSGRAYDPQASYSDPHTITVVFSGYNTPQPSANLGDYRSIGRFRMKVRN